MCYHTSVQITAKDLVKIFNAPFPKEEKYKVLYLADGFAHPDMAVLSHEQERSLNIYSWGLIPLWAKDWNHAVKVRNHTLNARLEDVFKKPSYRAAILSRRCVIPVTGIFEWKDIGKERIPFYIHPKEHPVFYLAGIYSHWTDPSTRDQITTFSLLTCVANEMMNDIHSGVKHMPLMLDREVIDDWISPDLSHVSIKELINPCNVSNMATYTVSKDFSKKSR
jgi:putative SOS response-associated peptidase YedK